MNQLDQLDRIVERVDNSRRDRRARREIADLLEEIARQLDSKELPHRLEELMNQRSNAREARVFVAARKLAPRPRRRRRIGSRR